MIILYNKYKESGLTVGEIRKVRQSHEQKTGRSCLPSFDGRGETGMKNGEHFRQFVY